MYMSRMQLDANKRSTMKALARPSMFHGAVEGAFTKERGRNLWRIDRLGGRYYLLLVSPVRPDLSAAVQQFGMEDGRQGWETLDYKPLLNRLENGQRWHFRLVANPTRSCSRGEGQRGAVRAHSSEKYQKIWLQERAGKHGFSLTDEDFMMVQDEWHVFEKGTTPRKKVSLLAVTFEGTLTITDAGLFREVLIKGIGRGKAYGLGMLTIVRADQNG